MKYSSNPTSQFLTRYLSMAWALLIVQWQFLLGQWIVLRVKPISRFLIWTEVSTIGYAWLTLGK